MFKFLKYLFKILFFFLLVLNIFLLNNNFKDKVSKKLNSNIEIKTDSSLEKNISKKDIDSFTRVVDVIEESKIIDVIKDSKPAVVSILKENASLDYLLSGSEDFSIGTGFLVRGGLVFTNRHVVDEDYTYKILLSDGETQYKVSEVHKDPLNDFAILQLEGAPKTLPYLNFGDSLNIQVGQSVIAIGNSLGEFANTASKGIISGLNRKILADNGSFGEPSLIEGVLQTDAALNSGNSGGPLLDLSGNVIGINVAIARNGNDVGFSIPIDNIMPVYNVYLKRGKIERVFLGINYSTDFDYNNKCNLPIPFINEEDKDYTFEIKRGYAVIGKILENSSADLSGLKVCDIITHIDSIELDNEDNKLSKILQNKFVGDTIILDIYRKDKSQQVEVLLKGLENGL